jgi:hypothetical protein
MPENGSLASSGRVAQTVVFREFPGSSGSPYMRRNPYMRRTPLQPNYGSNSHRNFQQFFILGVIISFPAVSTPRQELQFFVVFFDYCLLVQLINHHHHHHLSRPLL